MAKIKYHDKEIEIPDGSSVREPCESVGVPFNCRDGTCGTCIVEVIEGKENLTPLNQKEKNLGMDETFRLSCQCKIKSGEVEVDF